MGIKELYRTCLHKLQTLYPANEAAAILDRLFEAVAGIQRSDLIKTPALELSALLSTRLQDCFDQLMEHCPLQYVLGEAWFYGMKLSVNNDVLVPRPETEELVKLLIDNTLQSGKKGRSIHLLDIGTGSGCIAIAIKKHLPHALVTGIDISDAALKVARQNARYQQVEIDFKTLDFLMERAWSALPVFDVIVSNPPYIPLSEKDQLDKNVSRFEPGTALFVPDQSPFLFYDKMVGFATDHLSETGKIFVEFHETYARETAAVFGRLFNSVQVIKDIFGKERMIVASSKRNDAGIPV